MNKFRQNISKAEVNEFELDHYKGEIQIITNAEELFSAFEEINKYDFVGFDTESKPAFRKGTYNHVALIQIATPVKAYLIRLHKTGFSNHIKDFFENSKIKKIGVGLLEDIRDLQKLGPFEPNSFLQLNKIVKEIDIESNGLRKLTAIILGFRISKAAQVSNWEAESLTQKQINYAATDAWVCLEMYQKLLKLNMISK